MPEKEHMSLCLRVLTGLQKGASIPFKEGVVTIGSTRDAHIVLKGEHVPLIALEVVIRKKHIEILHVANDVFIGKEKATNGMNIEMYAPIKIGTTTVAYGPSKGRWPSDNKTTLLTKTQHVSENIPRKSIYTKTSKPWRVFSSLHTFLLYCMKLFWMLMFPLRWGGRTLLALPLIGTLLMRMGDHLRFLLVMGKRFVLLLLSPFIFVGQWMLFLLWKTITFLLVRPFLAIVRLVLLPLRVMQRSFLFVWRNMKKIFATTWWGLTYNKTTKWASFCGIVVVGYLALFGAGHIPPSTVPVAPLVVVKDALGKQPIFAHLLLSYQAESQHTVVVRGLLRFNQDINQLRRLVRKLRYPVVIKVRSRENIEAALSFFKERLPGVIETQLLPLGNSSVQLSVKGVLETSFLLSHDLETMFRNEIPGVVSVLVDVIGTEELEKKSRHFLQQHVSLRFVKSTLYKYHIAFSGAILGNYGSAWKMLLADFRKTLPSPTFARSLVHSGPFLDINVHSYTIGERPFIRFSQGGSSKQLRNVPGDFIALNMILEKITKEGLVLLEDDYRYFYAMTPKKRGQTVSALSQDASFDRP